MSNMTEKEKFANYRLIDLYKMHKKLWNIVSDKAEENISKKINSYKRKIKNETFAWVYTKEWLRIRKRSWI